MIDNENDIGELIYHKLMEGFMKYKEKEISELIFHELMEAKKLYCYGKVYANYCDSQSKTIAIKIMEILKNNSDKNLKDEK